MIVLEKVTYAIAGLMAFLIVGFVFAYWWTTRVPSRPAGVHADAVFLWAPAVGLPAPRRGRWLACWDDNSHTRCRLSDIGGTLEYEGEFVLLGAKGPVSASQLKIDSEKTRDDSVWIGQALVPLVYLQSGDVLVPLSKYDESVRLLQQRGRTR
jgi:hypothetical protein